MEDFHFIASPLPGAGPNTHLIGDLPLLSKKAQSSVAHQTQRQGRVCTYARVLLQYKLDAPNA